MFVTSIPKLPHLARAHIPDATLMFLLIIKTTEREREREESVATFPLTNTIRLTNQASNQANQPTNPKATLHQPTNGITAARARKGAVRVKINVKHRPRVSLLQKKTATKRRDSTAKKAEEGGKGRES